MEPHRHLIHEIKDELDWAAEEVARTEKIVMALEVEYNVRIAKLQGGGKVAEAASRTLVAEKERRQERLDLAHAFGLQTRAVRRFALVSRVYEIGCSGGDVEAIREDLVGFLFRQSDDTQRVAGADDTLDELSRALFGYFHVEMSDQNDQAVTTAWLKVETVLQRLGREI